MPTVRQRRSVVHWIGPLGSVKQPSLLWEWLYLSVKTGNEAQISIDRNSQPDYREKLNAELKAMRDKEMWRAGETVRKLRLENN